MSKRFSAPLLNVLILFSEEKRQQVSLFNVLSNPLYQLTLNSPVNTGLSGMFTPLDATESHCNQCKQDTLVYLRHSSEPKIPL